MSREMIVGGEHLTGHSRHHDYDELMEVGAEAAPVRPQLQMPPQAQPPPQPYPHMIGCKSHGLKILPASD